jgi:hypothetical protein
MAYTIKYYSYTTHVNNFPVFEEDVNGAHPGIEWTDSNGNTFQSIVTDFYPSLMFRRFEIKCFKFVKAKGRTNWSFDEEYTFVSDDNRYLNASNGQDTTESDPMAISSAQFFINNIGKNLNNVPLALYQFFLNQIIIKEQLS